MPRFRLRVFTAAATTALCAAAATPLAAQPLMPATLLRSYTFSGCGTLGSCHEGRISLYQVPPDGNPWRPTPDWLGIGYEITHTMPYGSMFSGASLPDQLRFTRTSGSVFATVDAMLPGPSCPFYLAFNPNPAPVCTRTSFFGGGPYDTEAWASPDFAPTAVRFDVLRGIPGNVTAPVEREEVSFALTPVAVVPEPATLALVGAGLLLLTAARMGGSARSTHAQLPS